MVKLTVRKVGNSLGLTLPAEAVKMSEKRLIAINRAWEEISAQRGD